MVAVSPGLLVTLRELLMRRNPLDWGVRMAPGGFADYHCVDGSSLCMDYSDLVELDSGGLVI